MQYHANIMRKTLTLILGEPEKTPCFITKYCKKIFKQLSQHFIYIE